METNYLLTLPNELTFEIIDRLDAMALYSFLGTDKRLYGLPDESFWEQKLKSLFGRALGRQSVSFSILYRELVKRLELEGRITYLIDTNASDVLRTLFDSLNLRRARNGQLLFERTSNGGVVVANTNNQLTYEHLTQFLLRAVRRCYIDSLTVLMTLVNNVNIAFELPFAEAIKTDNVDIVRFFIDNGALKGGISNWMPLVTKPVNVAIERGNIDILRLFHSKGEDLSFNRGFAIVLAVERNDIELTRFYLSIGVHLAVKGGILIRTATLNNNTELLTLLLSIIPLTTPALLYDSTILAAKNGYVDVLSALLNAGANKHCRACALTAAVENGQGSIIKLLLAMETPPNSPTEPVG